MFKILYRERVCAAPLKEERENTLCTRFYPFTKFSFGLSVSLHPNSELDILIVDLERFRKTHTAVKSVLRNNTV